MPEITTVFNSNQTQVAELPTEVRFSDEVKKVMVCIRGCDRIITPLESN